MKLSREFITALLVGIGFTFGMSIAAAIINILTKVF